MSNVTPEYLFQRIGEKDIEADLLRREVLRLQKEIVDSKEPIKKD